MADITMSYSSLQEAAGKVNTAKGDLEQVISFLTSAVSALEGTWSGESYNAFVNAWNESKPTMERLKEAVGNFAPELNNAVTRQQETEAMSSVRMENLSF